jgi:APA family basic amino acid/polyamine antiporter
MLFYMLTMIGVFVVRRRPVAQVSYHAPGFPLLPIVYLILAAFIEFQLLRYKPEYTWPGLVMVVLGVAVYFLWKKGR